jgi:hypothetical protein
MQPVTDPELLRILNGGGAAPAGGPVYGPAPVAPAPPSPIAQSRLDLDRQKFEYQQQQDAIQAQEPPTTANDQKAAAKAANLDALVQQINRVQDLYDRNLRDEAIPLLSSLGEFLPTEDNRQFDTAAAGMAEQGLAAFRVPGVGAQSDTELRQFVDANKPSASDYDASIEEKLRQLRTRVDANRAAIGLPPAQWGTAPQDDRDPAAVAATVDTGGAPPPGPDGNPTPPVFSPGAPQYEASQGTRTEEDNPALAAEYRARIQAGQTAGEIIPWLRSQGASNETLMQAAKQLQYRRANPDVPVDRYSITSTREVPLTLYEQATTAAGNAELPGGFSPGAYAIGAGQFLSGNTLDNMAADPERARLAESVMAANNPGSTMAGQISGGVLASLSGEAGLARLGMAAGLGRATLADVAMGAANGAGATDDGSSRRMGAAQGGVAAGVGSLAGAGAMNVAGRAVSPSGGNLAELYQAGVRPTPGQRFGNSGLIGRAVNATEEALQSVPVVGAAISGARQEARDQFQVGAFNQALAEIGDQLPKGMKPGTDPHRYAQEAFGRVYDQARGAMRVVADEELSNNLGQLAPDIATLGPAAQNKLKAIMQNTVNNRIADGALEGAAYKTAVSDLGKHIARLRRSAMGEDQALADVVEGVRGALDAGARRHSDPEAIALLDAADAGYARLVRIEQAAARRGGDDGTFSPTGFDSAVQGASGGVRSKAYLRGDALMQDYANAGKNLVDRTPNSGTTDRALAATAVAGGAAYLEPTTLSVLGAIGAAYAPGVRRVTTGAMAPGGKSRKAIAARMKKIARLSGKAGAGLAAVGALETTPSQ